MELNIKMIIETSPKFDDPKLLALAVLRVARCQNISIIFQV